MKTWLTYLAALLLSGATAFAFPYSTGLLNAMNFLTSLFISVSIFLFIPISFITFTSGVASLRKDKIAGKAVGYDILWSIVTSFVLALLAILHVRIFSSSIPVTSSAGGDYVTLYNEFISSYDIFGIVEVAGTGFLPLLLAAIVFGIALTPSSDVIRPAYTVMNSLSEAMYRIERIFSNFGALFVYVAGTAFFLNLWQEKTAFVSPSFFIDILLSTLVLIVVVLPLLYLIFTKFKKNPYLVIGRAISSLILGFVSGNIYVTSLQNEAIIRNNTGVQKRIVSVTTPLGILITRGGTCFVSVLSVLSILSALDAKVTAVAAILIALTVVCLSLISFMSAGCETTVIAILLFRVMNINVYGAEAALISIIPFLNSVATLLDVTLISLASNIEARMTKTDINVPAEDVI